MTEVLSIAFAILGVCAMLFLGAVVVACGLVCGLKLAMSLYGPIRVDVRQTWLTGPSISTGLPMPTFVDKECR